MFNFKVGGLSNQVATLDSDGTIYRSIAVCATENNTHAVAVTIHDGEERAQRMSGFGIGGEAPRQFASDH